MANQQDIDQTARRCRDALKSRDLAASKKALEDLGALSAMFSQMKAKLVGDQQAMVEELRASCEGVIGDLKPKVSAMEIDMMDPDYEQRSKARDQEKAAREAAERAKAAQVLQGLGGPFAALAGLANLGGARSEPTTQPAAAPAAAPGDDVSCGSCGTANPRRAKFCMECGKPMARKCSQCGADLGKAKFCPECGTKA